MHMRKGLAPVVWVVIAAVILAGGYFLLKPNQYCWPYCPGMTDQDRETIKKSALEAQTANWKTYRNDKYGFGVKYPSMDVQKKLQPFEFGNTISFMRVGEETRFPVTVDIVPLSNSQPCSALEYVSSRGFVGEVSKKEVALDSSEMIAAEVRTEYRQGRPGVETYFSKRNCSAGDPLIRISTAEQVDVYQTLLSTFRFTPTPN